MNFQQLYVFIYFFLSVYIRTANIANICRRKSVGCVIAIVTCV